MMKPDEVRHWVINSILKPHPDIYDRVGAWADEIENMKVHLLLYRSHLRKLTVVEMTTLYKAGIIIRDPVEPNTWSLPPHLRSIEIKAPRATLKALKAITKLLL